MIVSENNTNYNGLPQFIDSHGRKTGSVNGFASYNEQMLAYMKKDLSLFMSLDDLIFCRNYYRDTKQNTLTLSEIYLFDAIVQQTRAIPVGNAIIDLLTSDERISLTFSDLFAKHSYVCGNIVSPLTLCTAAEVCSQYMKKVGISFSKVAPDALEGFSLSNGRKLLSPANVSEDTLPSDTALLMLSPADIDSDYPKLIDKFRSSESFKSLVIKATDTDTRGVAYSLSQFCFGVLGDLYSLPDTEYPAELSDLAQKHHGRTIIAVNRENVASVTAAVSKYGLIANYFAKTIPSPQFVLLNNKNASMKVDMELIRLLGGSMSAAAFEVNCTETEDSFDKSPVFADTANGAYRIRYGDLILKSNVLYSAVSKDLSDSYFISGINTVIDALLPMIACGVRLTDISVNTKYVFSSLLTEKARGDALASILGVYRAFVETCVADSPDINYDENESPSLSCVAHATMPKAPVPSHIKEIGDALYLFSYNKAEDGMPDFESFRGMIAAITELISSGKARALRAVSGNISDAMADMRGNLKVVFEPSISDLLGENIRGFIVESPFPLSGGILLGAVAANAENSAQN